MMKFLGAMLGLLLMIPLGVHAQEERETLTVFAAASLTDAFEELADAFEAQYPYVEVVYSFGGSSQLAAQIIEGAPVDVFASANARQMTLVEEAGLVAGEALRFARNRLVVIVPNDNPANIETLADLARPGLLLVLAAPGVPIRDYTEIMLEKMAADPDYGPDYRQAVLDNLVSEEDNVRQVVAKIALGEGDAGIVYLSDVTPDQSPNLKTITVPSAFNTIASYPIAALTGAANPETAQAFVDFTRSVEGQCILKRWNFLTLRSCRNP